MSEQHQDNTTDWGNSTLVSEQVKVFLHYTRGAGGGGCCVWFFCVCLCVRASGLTPELSVSVLTIHYNMFHVKRGFLLKCT